MTYPRRASDKHCRSRAENAKNHTKSELLFARQPDLAAAHTSVAFPLNPFYGNSEAKLPKVFFFQKTTAGINESPDSPALSTLNPQLLTDLVRRHRRPGAHTKRGQHDFNCQRAKDKPHDTDEDGRALATD